MGRIATQRGDVIKRAFLNIKKDPHYRRFSFESGLRRLGFGIVEHPLCLGEGDVAIFWNLYAGSTEVEAASLKARGVTVIVAENGYIGKDANGVQLYAMALDGHNGSGRWFVGERDRLEKFGIRAEPLKKAKPGAPFLICGQRGIGSSTMASPPGWHHRIEQELARAGIPYVTRPHPGMDQRERARLEDQILASAGVVIWSSACGVASLTLGVPVWRDAPHWVCEGAASVYKGPESLSSPNTSDEARRAALHRMSWAQWSVEEITEAEPFVALLYDIGHQNRAAA